MEVILCLGGHHNMRNRINGCSFRKVENDCSKASHLGSHLNHTLKNPGQTAGVWGGNIYLETPVAKQRSILTHCIKIK